jgi:hypothetical protein
MEHSGATEPNIDNLGDDAHFPLMETAGSGSPEPAEFSLVEGQRTSM